MPSRRSLIEPYGARDGLHSNCQDNERRPVLLTSEEQFETWLTGSAEKAFSLLQTSDPERMHIVQSGLEKEYRGEGLGNGASAPGELTPARREARQTSLFDEF